MDSLFIKNLVEVYGPDPIGPSDVLIQGGRVAALADAGTPRLGYSETVVDASGLVAVPGFIDSHIHFTGAGSVGAGPITRDPDFGPSEFWLAGITTAIGAPGADYVTRSMPNLIAKARALEAEGITTHIWTGGYRNPPASLTESVALDLLVCEKVAGAKIAISDFMAPPRTLDQLHDVVWQILSGSQISGKAGVVHVHTGVLPPRIQPILDLVKRYEYGSAHWSSKHGGESQSSVGGHFQITHANWTMELLDECMRFAATGGRIDFTAGMSPAVGFEESIPPSHAARLSIDSGVPVDRLSISSDSGGSEAKLDEHGAVTDLIRLRPPRIYDEFLLMVKNEGISIADAVRITSTNVAQLHRWRYKGRIAEGSDADILLLDADLSLRYVISKGIIRLRDGVVVQPGWTERDTTA